MRLDGHSAAPTTWWSDRNVLRRFIADLVAGELARLRPGWSRPLGQAWGDTCAVDLDLGADSLELLQLGAAVAQALHLHEAGNENLLLARRTLGDWVDVAAAGLEHYSARVSFTTSGSTGKPKTCGHDMATLRQECAALATLFDGTRRLLFAVPSHHIYGFLLTILLPDTLGLNAASVIDLRGTMPSRLSGILQSGDLVVGYPEFWHAASRATPHFVAEVTGVTSTGPCAEDVCDILTGAGIARLVQIYGSSETAGIGSRSDPRAAYRLFPYWAAMPGAPDRLSRRGPDNVLADVTLPDCVTWVDDQHFMVGARRDTAVQVGGINVFPAHVAARLKEHALVIDAAVRLMRPEEGSRLKAYVVLKPEALDIPASLDDLRTWIDRTLPVAQRPKALTIGPCLPTGATGKPCDWQIAAS